MAIQAGRIGTGIAVFVFLTVLSCFAGVAAQTAPAAESGVDSTNAEELPVWQNSIRPIDTRQLDAEEVWCEPQAESLPVTRCPSYIRSLFAQLKDAPPIDQCGEKVLFAPKITGPHSVETRDVRCFSAFDQYACHLFSQPAFFDHDAGQYFFAWAPLSLDEALEVARTFSAGRVSIPERYKRGAGHLVRNGNITQISRRGSDSTYGVSFNGCSCNSGLSVMWRDLEHRNELVVVDMRTICS